MCMKSVNITTLFFEDDLSGVTGGVRFGNVMGEVTAKKDIYNNYFIERLYIFTIFNAMSSSEDENLTNKYDLMWTFGYLNGENFDNRMIGNHTVDTTHNKIEKNKVSSRGFTNQKFNIPLLNYEVTEPGMYYLKVYIRRHDSDASEPWQVQSINSIEVKFE